MTRPTPIVIRFDSRPGRTAPIFPGESKPAAFLDRDGVLNADHGFVSSVEEWEWIDGAQDAIRLLNRSGFAVVVATNQSGIGRRMFDEERFIALMEWVEDQLQNVGAHLDAVYACPHHPTEASGDYRVVCTCRKPAPGLFEAAVEDLSIDRARSVAIGDTERDLAAARAARVAALLFPGGNLRQFVGEQLGLSAV